MTPRPSRVARLRRTAGTERASERPDERAGPFPGAIGPTVVVALLAAMVAGAVLRLSPPARPALAQSSLAALPASEQAPQVSQPSPQPASPLGPQPAAVPSSPEPMPEPPSAPVTGPMPGPQSASVGSSSQPTPAPSLTPPTAGPRSAVRDGDPFGPGFPRRTISADAPLRVLVVGDSVMLGAEIAVAAALEATGAVEVEQVAVADLGLSRLDGYDWRSEWPTVVQRVDPEVVIVHVGVGDGARARANGPLWYQGIVEHAVRILGAGGAEILWVGAAPNAWYLDDEPERQAVNDVFASLPERFPGVVSYLAPESFVTDDDGRFAFDLPGLDGAHERIRMSDGVHLCAAGAARFGDAVLAALHGHWNLTEPVAAWRQGDWRLDPRFGPAVLGPCPPPAA